MMVGDLRAGKLALRKIANNELQVRKYLSPALENVKLKTLTSMRVQEPYDSKFASGMSVASVRYMHAVLRRSMELANKRWKLIALNPADDVDLPKVRVKTPNTLSMEYVDQFLPTAAGSRYEALYHVVFFCCLRIGEILGLKWNDADFEGRIIRMCRQLQRMRDGSGLQLLDPKQDEHQDVDFGRRAAESLKNHRLGQDDERLAAGASYETQGFIEGSRLGTPLDPSNVDNRGFKPILGNTGLPDMRFHETRHTCATLIISKGVDPGTVQKVLGHKDVVTTLKYYALAMPGLHRRTAQVFDEVS